MGAGALVVCALVGAFIIWVAVGEWPGTPKSNPAPPVQAPAAEAPQVPQAPQQKAPVAVQPAPRGGAGPAPNEGEAGVEYRTVLGDLSRRFGLSPEQVADRLVAVHDIVKKETGADLKVLDMGQVLAASSDAMSTLAGSVPAALQALHQRLPTLFPPPSAGPFDDFTAVFATLVVQKIKANPSQTASWAANEVAKDLVALCWTS
jgi:hypothetical protein